MTQSCIYTNLGASIGPNSYCVFKFSLLFLSITRGADFSSWVFNFFSGILQLWTWVFFYFLVENDCPKLQIFKNHQQQYCTMHHRRTYSGWFTSWPNKNIILIISTKNPRTIYMLHELQGYNTFTLIEDNIVLLVFEKKKV
jgi:hypothetical protein